MHGPSCWQTDVFPSSRYEVIFFFIVAENDNGALAGVELETFSNVIRKHTLLTEVVCLSV